MSFRGRTDRQTFFAMTVLLYMLGVFFVISAATGLLSLISASNVRLDLPAKEMADSLNGMQLPTSVGWVALLVGLLGLIWVVLGLVAISVRRLHDIGLTGYLALVLPALQAVIPLFALPAALPLVGPAHLLWSLILVVPPGTRGANAFGPDPGQAQMSAPD